MDWYWCETCETGHEDPGDCPIAIEGTDTEEVENE